MFTDEQKETLKISHTKFTGIAAVNNKNYIGLDGKLVDSDKDDMRYFVNTTRGHVVVMGRKTFESCKRPLLGRNVCVLSRNPIKIYPDAIVLSPAQLVKHMISFEQVYIAGGAEVYKIFDDVYSEFVLTHIPKDTVGDVLMPIDFLHGWRMVYSAVPLGLNTGGATLNKYIKVRI